MQDDYRSDIEAETPGGAPREPADGALRPGQDPRTGQDFRTDGAPRPGQDSRTGQDFRTDGAPRPGQDPRTERPRFRPEIDPEAGRRPRSRGQRSSKRFIPILLPALLFLAGLGAGAGVGYMVWGYTAPYTVDLKAIETPDWIEQKLLRKNIFSRPDVSMREVKNIVVHYVGNPGTSAESNQRYFDSLADQDPEQGGVSSSSHFIIGLEGEIIQCIPLNEISYANAPRNFDTVTIEVCHPDDTGKFTSASYDSLVKLTAWLCGELALDEKDVIRHYDVNGKGCPKYYVDHEDAWKRFRQDLKAALKEQ